MRGGLNGFATFLPAGSAAQPLDRSRSFFLKNVLFLLITLIFSVASPGQEISFDKKLFFQQDNPVAFRLEADLRHLVNNKDRPNPERQVQPATIVVRLPDSTELKEQVEIRPRGDFRREECQMPPIRINFKPAVSPLKKLGSLKFVWPCENTDYHEQLVLREYLAYRLYNLLSERSFRVRLALVDIADTKDHLRNRSWYGFFIEDVDDLAKRNGCREIDSVWYPSEQTEREQTTLLALFQYMIGNTDWGIPVYHNIKLIQPRNDSFARPYAIPFDFDGSGLVNAPYAIPDQTLGIATVRQRCYRGFSRSYEEIQAALDVFRSRHTDMLALINHCELLTSGNRKDMINYIEEFFQIVASGNQVKNLFVNQARSHY